MENIFNADVTMEQNEQNGAAPAESSTNNDVVGLSEMMTADEHPEAQEQTEPEQKPAEKAEEPVPAKEPAWYRRQLSAERKKWDQEKAAYEAKLATYAEKELEAEAEKLAAEENVSKAFALRLLRAEKGIATPAPKAEPEKAAPARDEKGRFTKAEEPAAEEAEDPTRERAQELINQNELLLKSTGVNALELYQNNEKVRAKVNSGEWDFADVVRVYMEETGGRRVPSPVRHANGAKPIGKSIWDLSDKQFEELNRKLDMGYKIDPGR